MKFSRWILLLLFLCLAVKTVWSRPDKKAVCHKKCKDCKKTEKCECKKGVENTAFCFNDTNEADDESLSASGSEDSDATSNQEQKHVTGRPGPCDINPCKNGGTCLADGTKYKCRCTPGYNPENECQRCEGRFGHNCRHECTFCHKDFDCHPVTGCKKCKFGFMNSKKRVNDCKKIDCKQNPCKNGGQCQTTAVQPCACPVDTTGLLCQTKISTSSLQKCTVKLNINKCKNGGTCYSRGRTTESVGHIPQYFESENPSCLCPKQYAGTYCTKSCKSGSQNCPHGSCKQPPGSGNKGKKVCVCHAGWKGGKTDPHCEAPCDREKWGVNCLKDCGFCAKQPCDPLDGLCPPGGCLDNFQGDRCDISTNISTDETENNFASQADHAPEDKEAKISGNYLLIGKFPESPAYKKLLQRDNERFLKSSSRRTLNQQTTKGIRAIAMLRRGSVIVDFSLFVPRELVSGQTNIQRDMAKGLRNDAKDFRSSVGNYSVDRSSIKVTSVSSNAADTSAPSLVMVLTICGVIGLLTVSVAMIVRKVRRRRTLPAAAAIIHPHHKMAISGGFRAASTNRVMLRT